jgi:hypothetical protein
MNRAVFALCLGLAAAPAAAQPAPAEGAAPQAAPGEGAAATYSLQTQAHECEPYPECVVISSPLRPGAPGIGIRDKALLDQLKAPMPQSQTSQTKVAPAKPPQ